MDESYDNRYFRDTLPGTRDLKVFIDSLERSIDEMRPVVESALQGNISDEALLLKFEELNAKKEFVAEPGMVLIAIGWLCEMRIQSFPEAETDSVLYSRYEHIRNRCLNALREHFDPDHPSIDDVLVANAKQGLVLTFFDVLQADDMFKIKNTELGEDLRNSLGASVVFGGVVATGSGNILLGGLYFLLAFCFLAAVADYPKGQKAFKNAFENLYYALKYNQHEWPFEVQLDVVDAQVTAEMEEELKQDAPDKRVIAFTSEGELVREGEEIPGDAFLFESMTDEQKSKRLGGV